MKIIYFASLRDRLDRSEESVTLDTKTSIKVFLEKHLGPEFTGGYLFAVNEEVVPEETELTDGDTLAIFPPFSGGL
jgi:molybdopterin converting factor small subunit